MYFILYTYMKNTSSCVFTPTAIEGAIVCKHKELSFLYAKKKNYALKYLEKKLLMVKSLKSQIWFLKVEKVKLRIYVDVPNFKRDFLKSWNAIRVGSTKINVSHISLKILFLHGHFCSIARHLWNCTLLSFIWKIGFFCCNFCNKNSHFIFSNFSEQHIHITISSDNYCSIYIRIVFCKKISYLQILQILCS